MLTETKLDDFFQTMQFNIEGYHTFRLNRNEYGGGILLYVRDDIPSKSIPVKKSTIEGFFIELNLRKKKWLLCYTYNPTCSFTSDHLSTDEHVQVKIGTAQTEKARAKSYSV